MDYQMIFEELQAKYGQSVISVEVTESLAGITDSKLGGIPYVSQEMRSKVFNYGAFIAQLNLSEFPDNDFLPKSGILQFWTKKQGGIIYYPTIDETVQFDDIPNNIYDINEANSILYLKNYHRHEGKRLRINVKKVITVKDVEYSGKVDLSIMQSYEDYAKNYDQLLAYKLNESSTANTFRYNYEIEQNRLGEVYQDELGAMRLGEFKFWNYMDRELFFQTNYISRDIETNEIELLHLFSRYKWTISKEELKNNDFSRVKYESKFGMDTHYLGLQDYTSISSDYNSDIIKAFSIVKTLELNLFDENKARKNFEQVCQLEKILQSSYLKYIKLYIRNDLYRCLEVINQQNKKIEKVNKSKSKTGGTITLGGLTLGVALAVPVANVITLPIAGAITAGKMILDSSNKNPESKPIETHEDEGNNMNVEIGNKLKQILEKLNKA